MLKKEAKAEAKAKEGYFQIAFLKLDNQSL